MRDSNVYNVYIVYFCRPPRRLMHGVPLVELRRAMAVVTGSNVSSLRKLSARDKQRLLEILRNSGHDVTKLSELIGE